jgi:hypothetical protein
LDKSDCYYSAKSTGQLHICEYIDEDHYYRNLERRKIK